MPFDESNSQQTGIVTLPSALHDYLELVEWTGRIVRSDKKGFIRLAQPQLLGTLKLSEQQWRVLALEIQKKSILMLHGLNRLDAIEKQNTKF